MRAAVLMTPSFPARSLSHGLCRSQAARRSVRGDEMLSERAREEQCERAEESPTADHVAG